MTDVLIVGAGMAGLRAALDIRARGLSCLVIEAMDKPGGRACSRRTATGTTIDLGAHWLHGEDTPLRGTLDHYGLGYHEETEGEMFVQNRGKLVRSEEDWIETAIDWDRAKAVKARTAPDVALPELGVDDAARERLGQFGLMWNGIDPPYHPSAYEFLTDENTRGGLQPKTGMGAIIDAMARDLGTENLRLNTPVRAVVSQKDHVDISCGDGTRFMGRVALFTGSLGVLKSNAVTFEPALTAEFRRHLSGIVMGKMNKIVIELTPAFFERRQIAVDTGLILLDARPPHFCHMRSAGSPVIQLYICGRQAEMIEGMTSREALDYLHRVLAPVEKLSGFEDHVVGDPVVSAWVSNPYTQGAYSCCLPGTRRQGPHREARVFFAGDTFDARFPASVAGAFRSGEEAARQIAAALDIHAGPSVWTETYQI